MRKEGIDADGVVIDVDNADSIKKAALSVEHNVSKAAVNAFTVQLAY